MKFAAGVDVEILRASSSDALRMTPCLVLECSAGKLASVVLRKLGSAAVIRLREGGRGVFRRIFAVSVLILGLSAYASRAGAQQQKADAEGHA